MRFFLSYKFTGVDKTKLKKLLELVTGVLQKNGHTSFSFFRDIQKWGIVKIDKNNIIPLALKQLKNTDALLVILDASTKSTGIGIEVGYAVAPNKPILVLKRKEVNDDYIESVSELVAVYQKEEDIPLELNNILNKSSQHRL